MAKRNSIFLRLRVYTFVYMLFSMSSADSMVAVAGVVVTSKQTAKAIYVAQLYLSECQGSTGDAQWMPKSVFESIEIGESFSNGTEVRREFTALIPAWLARKVLSQRPGPVPYATRPW